MDILSRIPGQFHTALPLIALRSPADVWASEPAFLAGEVLFHLLLSLLTYWIYKQEPQARKRYAALWLASLASGASVELLTILCHNVGNFYHAQVTSYC